jgi:hypothetical protein
MQPVALDGNQPLPSSMSNIASDQRSCNEVLITPLDAIRQRGRYKGTVTAGAVRDFLPSMAGRGEKGLLITTGSFTKDAQNEASRDGAPPVELIDGDRLCDLLRDYRLGVEVRERVELMVVVDPAFFDEYGLVNAASPHSAA